MLMLTLLISLLFTRYDVANYDPEGKFEVGRYYKHPYSQILYVREQAVLHDGTVVLVIENIKGKTCLYSKICEFPANTKKGVWIEVERID